MIVDEAKFCVGTQNSAFQMYSVQKSSIEWRQLTENATSAPKTNVAQQLIGEYIWIYAQYIQAQLHDKNTRSAALVCRNLNAKEGRPTGFRIYANDRKI